MDIYNSLKIESVAATVLSLLGAEAECGMEKPVSDIVLKGPCDRVFMYNPDAIGQWVFERNRELFEPVLSVSDVYPMLSVMPSVTPVCFASMYSGLSPDGHGIHEYVKPVLKCRTVFDVLSEKGLRVAVVSTEGDSVSKIFLERNIDYFIYRTKEECNRKALELIESDEHSLIVLYNGDYDYWMHRVSPEGKRAVRALSENIGTFMAVRDKISSCWKDHRTALAFAPDHGCHRTYGVLGNHGTDRSSDMNILHFWSFL